MYRAITVMYNTFSHIRYLSTDSLFPSSRVTHTLSHKLKLGDLSRTIGFSLCDTKGCHNQLQNCHSDPDDRTLQKPFVLPVMYSLLPHRSAMI
jgi:hypothetical protein